MNRSEQVAHDWLLEQGVELSEIVFRARKTPDFIVGDGRGYEVKRLYGNTIRFSAGQVDKLLEYENAVVLVVDDEAVVAEIEAAEFMDKPAKAGAFSVSYEAAAAVASTIKVQKGVGEAMTRLRGDIERDGWGALPPELHEFFQPGITQSGIMEAGLFLLERELKCQDRNEKQTESGT